MNEGARARRRRLPESRLSGNTGAESAAGPDRQPRGWARWSFRVVALGQTILIFDQAVFAGQFLSGDFGALGRHGENATYAGLATIGQIAAAVLLRWPGRGPSWPILACAGLFGLIGLQIALGHARLLTLHVPLGVAIITASVAVLWWAWMPAQAAPAPAAKVPDPADERSKADAPADGRP
jgi:hypothetical protein